MHDIGHLFCSRTNEWFLWKHPPEASSALKKKILLFSPRGRLSFDLDLGPFGLLSGEAQKEGFIFILRPPISQTGNSGLARRSPMRFSLRYTFLLAAFFHMAWDPPQAFGWRVPRFLLLSICLLEGPEYCSRSIGTAQNSPIACCPMLIRFHVSSLAQWQTCLIDGDGQKSQVPQSLVIMILPGTFARVSRQTGYFYRIGIQG